MIPNLFSKQTVPRKIPEELQRIIAEFKKTNHQEIFLKESFKYITSKWKGSRINFMLKFHRLFEKDLEKILKTKGYLHCTTMNYLLRVMAIKSDLFKDEDIQLVLTNFHYTTPHQYLKIKLNNNKILTLDPWSYQYSVDYKKHVSGFTKVTFNPIR